MNIFSNFKFYFYILNQLYNKEDSIVNRMSKIVKILFVLIALIFVLNTTNGDNLKSNFREILEQGLIQLSKFKIL